MFQDLYEKQELVCGNLTEKLVFLQQANSNVASKIFKEEKSGANISHLEEDLENVQDLSTELLQMVIIIKHFT